MKLYSLLAGLFLAATSAFAGKMTNLIEAGAFQTAALPFLQTGMQTHQFCSYDRAGDNFDWQYFPLYTDTNGECVIFDAMGPGCLYRQQMNLWHRAPIYKDVHIRYYFDDESKPRIDMDVSTFFSTNNPLGIFQSPLAWDGKDRFRILYHPMFFRKRLKMTLSSEPGGPPTVLEPWTGSNKVHPDGNGYHYHWYQYTYQLFTDNSQNLKSWTPEVGRRLMPALLKAWNIDDEHERAIQGCKVKTVSRKIEAGKTATLWQIRKAGVMTALRFQIAPANNVNALFDSWLKITFDGAAHPQIEAPLGCFFGIYRSNLLASYNSLLLSWSNNQACCYFPMPFWKSAVIQIENRGQSSVTVTATVDYKKASASSYPQDSCGYLFAGYHREDPRVEGQDYTYLQTSNCFGQVVGHVVDRWNTCMEENERTYFDGSETPWIEGDGFEDDHGMGWGLQNLTLPVFGAVSARGGAGGVYRFLLPDMYCFASGIKYGHQTYGPHSPSGFQGVYKVGAEESVTFWYGKLQRRLIQTDELDVGNSQSETAHHYHAQGDVLRTNGKWWYDGELNNVLSKTPPIVDDGVSFTNNSTFTVAISLDNRGVRLRRRTDKENNRQEARVFIDGQLVTERPWYSVDYEKTYRGIRWLDSDFEVPAKYTKGKSKINVRIEFANSETGRWNEYYYWIYSYLDDVPPAGVVTNEVKATVNFSPTNTGRPLNPAFVGLSYEKLAMTNSFFSSNNIPLIKLFSMIGPAVLRIGAGTVDLTCWGGLSNLPPITASQVDAFAGFVKALPANWSVIYGINFSVNNPANCAAEAAYVANALGPRLLGFEIGNEPEAYPWNGIRPGNFTYADFISQWRPLAAAVTNIVPGWTLIGPASGGNTNYTISFANYEKGVASMATQHYYRADGKHRSSTMQLLLQPDPKLPETVRRIASVSTNLPFGFREDECGSYSHGGVAGVSDAYGAALWSLDFMFTLALNGCDGLNFHGGGRSPYTPLYNIGTTVREVRPEFYGLKMFSLLPRGDVVPAIVTLASNINFTAYGVRQANGAISALLNNKDTNHTVAVSVNLGTDVTGAQLIELTGPSLYSTNGYTLGGASINPDGSWSGGIQATLSATNGQLTVYVPPISAFLLKPVVTSSETTFSGSGNRINLRWPTNYNGWPLELGSTDLANTKLISNTRIRRHEQAVN